MFKDKSGGNKGKVKNIVTQSLCKHLVKSKCDDKQNKSHIGKIELLR